MGDTTGAATRPRPAAVRLMRNLGLEPDPWQVEVLEAGHPRLLLKIDLGAQMRRQFDDAAVKSARQSRRREIVSLRPDRMAGFRIR